MLLNEMEKTMIKQDDRTKEQRSTHWWGVVATDRFMSGWGGARGGLSKCAWACDSLGRAEAVKSQVSSRREMKYVNIVDLRTYRPGRACAHFHIYLDNGK